MLARLLNGLRRPLTCTARIGPTLSGALAPRACRTPDPPKSLPIGCQPVKESEDREQLEGIARNVSAALKSLPNRKREAGE